MPGQGIVLYWEVGSDSPTGTQELARNTSTATPPRSPVDCHHVAASC